VAIATSVSARAAKRCYKMLYVQVLIAILLGVVIGWLWPNVATNDWINALYVFIKLISRWRSRGSSSAPWSLAFRTLTMPGRSPASIRKTYKPLLQPADHLAPRRGNCLSRPQCATECLRNWLRPPGSHFLKARV
jgi:hypothetical protein